jgi:hypothetical protein
LELPNKSHHLLSQHHALSQNLLPPSTVNKKDSGSSTEIMKPNAKHKNNSTQNDSIHSNSIVNDIHNSPPTQTQTTMTITMTPQQNMTLPKILTMFTMKIPSRLLHNGITPYLNIRTTTPPTPLSSPLIPIPMRVDLC